MLGLAFQNWLDINFVRIPPGTGSMGAPDDDPDAEDNERPRHDVRIERGFWMATTPVTLGQYRRFETPEPRPHRALDDRQAMNHVSWSDAERYIAWLNEQRPATESDCTYRLPTEREWEYACRAGSAGRFHYGDDVDYTQLDNYAWFGSNSWDAGIRHPRDVATKRPNAFGLYDMHGNVWEWTSDGWATYGDIVRLGESIRSTSTRVLRGGAFCHEPRYIRASDRDHYEPDYRHYYTGFRLCLDRNV